MSLLSWLSVSCVLGIEGTKVSCREETVVSVPGIMFLFVLQWKRLLIPFLVALVSRVSSMGCRWLGCLCVRAIGCNYESLCVINCVGSRITSREYGCVPFFRLDVMFVFVVFAVLVCDGV